MAEPIGLLAGEGGPVGTDEIPDEPRQTGLDQGPDLGGCEGDGRPAVENATLDRTAFEDRPLLDAETVEAGGRGAR